MIHSHKTTLLHIAFFVVTLHAIFLASQDVVLERTEPGDGSVPCPGQKVEYNCQILVGSAGLSWNIPNTEMDLRFTAASANGTVRTSEDGNFIATLNSRTGQDPDFMFDSTLMIQQVMNFSTNLTCSAGMGSSISSTTMVVVSGKFCTCL